MESVVRLRRTRRSIRYRCAACRQTSNTTTMSFDVTAALSDRTASPRMSTMTAVIRDPDATCHFSLPLVVFHGFSDF